ncbi:hypothetical protein CEXT_201511 [Caerostris extrusa]|uniref:TACO1/YebC-like second and third domain-containing protein n=1 Tax=Caerostris extrusa TaxID=172846 RepID=A0AAV4MTI1_CAEEX|nr:hypothetical protein CEXT_201511 [Caerostris extrusa]
MSFPNILKLSSSVFSRNVCTFSKNKFYGNNSFLVLNSLTTKRTTSKRYICNQPKLSTSNKQDVAQALICFKYLRLIKQAVREFGPFVEENKRLELLLKQANEHDIPSDFIDFALKISVFSLSLRVVYHNWKSMDKPVYRAKANVGILELLLYGNCHLIVQYEDVDNSVAKSHILSLCKDETQEFIRNNVKWTRNFDVKGIISLKKDNSHSTLVDLKKAQLLASNAGAQSVTETNDPEGFPYWNFYCDPSHLHKVKEHLTEEGCVIEESSVGFIPKRKIKLPDYQKNFAHKIIIELNKKPCIDKVYTNFML